METKQARRIAQKKLEVVLRLLKGESVTSLSRVCGVVQTTRWPSTQKPPQDESGLGQIATVGQSYEVLLTQMKK